MLASGLSSEPDCVITVDCSRLCADLIMRVSSTEDIDRIIGDLIHSIEVDITEFTQQLIQMIVRLLRNYMSNSTSVRFSNSPEATLIQPLGPEGLLFVFGLKTL